MKSSSVSPLLSEIDSVVTDSILYQRICVSEYTPSDKRQKYLFLRELEKGLSSPVFFFTYSYGSNVGNFHFLWKAPEHICEEACSSENLRLVEEI